MYPHISYMQQRKLPCSRLFVFCLVVFTLCFLGDQEASSIGEEACRMEDMETAEPDSTTVNSKVTSSFLLLLTFVSSPVGYRHTVPYHSPLLLLLEIVTNL
jgi:hypothetical protein